MLAPLSEEELADIIRAAGPEGLRITGGGTRLSIGHPVGAPRLSTGGFAGIRHYNAGALTLVAGAGTPLKDIEATLAAEDQMLPFEPMDHTALLGSLGEATIGGVVAGNISGPRRLSAGACRDSLLGVRFVDGRGTVLKNGGQVMKNVTGYDLVKLMAGSWGTLGVITEIALKLLPAPKARAVLLIEGLGDEEAIHALLDALASPHQVTGAAHLPVGRDGAPVTMIRIEGGAASVDYRAKALEAALAGTGQPINIETDMEKTAAGWRHIRDCLPFAGREGAIWRLSVKPSAAPALVKHAHEALKSEAFYDWGGGLVWMLVQERADAGAGILRGLLGQTGGHATLIRAGAEIRAGVDVFHPQPAPVQRLSTAVRQQFDPRGVLNPGLMGPGKGAV